MPDRGPLQYDLCHQLFNHFGKKLGIPIHYTENLHEEVTYRISANELRVTIGSDVIIAGASVLDDYQIVKAPDGTWLNEYQMCMRQGDSYVEVVDYPLALPNTKADIDAFRFPEPFAPGRYRDVEHLIQKFHDNYLVIGDIKVTIFSLAH